MWSFSNSTTHLPSLAQTHSDIQTLPRARTESFSLLDNVSVLDEGILEPAVEQRITRTMSDVLMGISTPIKELDGFVFEKLEYSDESTQSACVQDNALQILDLSTVGAKMLRDGSTFAVLLLRYLDTPAWKSLRLTGRVWYDILSTIAPPKFPASYRLPVEIVQQIYSYLGPKDFNAARHACRNWMTASLNMKILITILKRGGWLSTAEDYIERKSRNAEHSLSTNFQTNEWLMSRHISRECALSSSWTGNGLDMRPAIIESSEIDFSEMANSCTTSHGRERSGLVFTTSVCGNFLLVARNSMIYIHDLSSGFLAPVTSVVCPRRVLSLSMDASSGRHTVAALLEGRLGMVCELQHGIRPGNSSPVEVYTGSNRHLSQVMAKMSILTGCASEFESGMNSGTYTPPRLRSNFACAYKQDPEPFDAIEVYSNTQEIGLQETDDHRTYERNIINPTWNLDLCGPPTCLTTRVNAVAESHVRSIPVESGTSTFYRQLCSEDDPPRSVSICPQRHCVAFGCSAGIELHWIDALTGVSLNRWFPLTTPSDYLYFLSPRPGFESAKKLRLLSSAAHPNDRPEVCLKFCYRRPTVNSFWSSFGFDSSYRISSGYDHYHAIPLSDGHHVLFIDPPTGRLSLGCDAPFGGPTKLVRKVVFVPPEEKVIPRLYTAAADMSWGARVVVAYGDIVMLYNVPIDVIKLSQLQQKADNLETYNTHPFSVEACTEDHWLNWWDQPSALEFAIQFESSNKNPIWPLAICGTEIGKMSNVCELAVQTQPYIQIWTFTHAAQCKVWRLHNCVDPITRSKRYVCRNGLVHISHFTDETRDVVITDAPSPAPANVAVGLCVEDDEDEYPRTENSVFRGFDGNTSGVLKKIPKMLAVENDGYMDRVYDDGHSHAWYEGNGDVMVWYRDSKTGC